MKTRHRTTGLVLVLALAAMSAGRAGAEPDSFGLGSGDAGTLTVGAPNTVINTYATLIQPAAPGDTDLTVSSTAGFGAGGLVMVLQTTGLIPAPASGIVVPVNLSADPVGRWELARVQSVTASALSLAAPLVNSYAASVTQVISVPEYSSVTVGADAGITAAPWDGGTGGVVAFLVTGGLTNDGVIQASAVGFRGGQYTAGANLTACTGLDQVDGGAPKGEGVVSTGYGAGSAGRGNLANGAGGGVCSGSGGGGGGNSGTGGQGGLSNDNSRNVGGLGGASLLYSLFDHFTFGGGGGSGHGTSTSANPSGGAGGGIVFIRAGSLSGAGSILALGGAGGAGARPQGGQLAGGGGGGAGGAIHVRLSGAAVCGGISASGGAGGAGDGNSGAGYVGPGGGGGGGRVLLQATSLSGCPVSLGGGDAGTLPGSAGNDGAQPGSGATAVLLDGGFVIPAVPTVTAPTAGSFLHTPQPTFAGTTQAGTLVVVYLDGVELNRTQPDGGSWTLTSTSALSTGAHWVQAAAEYQGVQSVKSAVDYFVIDRTLAAPVVVQPVDGGLLDAGQVTFSGTAESDTTISLQLLASDGGTFTLPTGATTGGAWQITTRGQLADGTYQVSAKATNPWGDTAQSSAVLFTIDTTAPAAPVLNALGSRPRRSGIVSVSGTAEPGSTVTVLVNSASVGSTGADSQGSWGFTIPVVYSDGTYQAQARARDAAGNTGPACAAQGFTIDSTPPAAPVVSSPVDGASTVNVRPVIAGTAEGSSTVTLYVDSSQVAATVTADSSGGWSYTPPSAWTDGAHTVSARATDAAGNTGPYASLVTFTLNTSAPVILTPADNAMVRSPAFAGTAPPGSTVILSLGSTSWTATTTSSGSWNSTPPSQLADGSYTLTVTARYAADTVSSGPASVHFTVKTTPPSTPVIMSPGSGDALSNPLPTYSGTADTGDTVSVTVDNVPLGTATATNGTWNLASVWWLTEGSHSVQVTAADPAGNTAQSGVTSFSVRQPAPVLTSPASLSYVGTLTPTVSGQAQAGYTVRVYISDGSLSSSGQCGVGVQVGVLTATASASGGWSVTASGLQDGHLYAVRATAASGTNPPSPYSDALCFTVDTTAPSAPSVSTPADNGYLSTTQPSIAGTSEPYAKIDVELDGTLSGTAQADASGNWTFVPSALSEASHTVRVRATDRAGNIGAFSTARSFTVQVTPPAAPQVTSPAASGYVSAPRPVISGTAAAQSTVTLYIDSSTPAATMTVGSSGSWSFTPTSDLADGAHAITAKATDAAGNTSALSTLRIFTVDTSKPVILSPVANSLTRSATFSGTALPNSTVTLTVATGSASVSFSVSAGTGRWTFTPSSPLADGSYAVTAQAKDQQGNDGPVSDAVPFTVRTSLPGRPAVTSPTADAIIKDPSLSFSGTADTGTTVSLFVDGLPFGAPQASSGTWTFAPSAQASWRLADGVHTVYAQEQDSAGNTAKSDTISFTVKEDATIIESPTSFSFTSTRTPVISGTARAGSAVSVSIYDGPGVSSTCIVAGSPRTQLPAVTVDVDGKWSVTATGLLEGSYAVRASATYGTNPTSRDSEPVCFNVKTTPPPPPMILGPADGAFTNSIQPYIRGTVEPFASVRIQIDGVIAGTAPQADSDGNWTFRAPVLAEGTHQVTGIAIDRALNESITQSSPVNFTVKVTAPPAPVVLLPTEGAITNGQSPSASGTAEPFATVSVLVDEQPAGTATADSAGHWSLTVSVVISDGAHAVIATATDRAGNVGPRSASVHFTVDTQAPGLVIDSGPKDRSRSSQSTFEFSSSKSGVTFECSLDGSAFTGCESPAIYINLHDGAHVFSVRGRDVAGNVTTANWSWTVDLGEDSAILGGGLSCAASGNAPSFLALLAPLAFVWLVRKSHRGAARRDEVSLANPGARAGRHGLQHAAHVPHDLYLWLSAGECERLHFRSVKPFTVPAGAGAYVALRDGEGPPSQDGDHAGPVFLQLERATAGGPGRHLHWDRGPLPALLLRRSPAAAAGRGHGLRHGRGPPGTGHPDRAPRLRRAASHVPRRALRAGAGGRSPGPRLVPRAPRAAALPPEADVSQQGVRQRERARHYRERAQGQRPGPRG